MKIMKQENNVAKSNIITLNILPKSKPISDELLLQIEDEIVSNKLVENAMDIANKVDIKRLCFSSMGRKRTSLYSLANEPL